MWNGVKWEVWETRNCMYRNDTLLHLYARIHKIFPLHFWWLWQWVIDLAGGAAITCKNELETINEENLHIVSKQLRQVMFPGSTSEKVPRMDWSKRPGTSETPSINDSDEDSDQYVLNSEKFIVVHGAGWYVVLFLSFFLSVSLL